MDQVAFIATDTGELTSTLHHNTTGNLTVGSYTTSSNCVTWPNYWYYSQSLPDKTGTAFRIAQALMEKKVVKIDNNVEKFLKLVNSIAECL